MAPRLFPLILEDTSLIECAYTGANGGSHFSTTYDARPKHRYRALLGLIALVRDADVAMQRAKPDSLDCII